MLMPDVDHEARKAELSASLKRARDHGIASAYMECGTDTYDLLTMMAIARVPLGEAEYARRRIEAGALELTFSGVRVIKCADVPERRLWPPRAVSVVASGRRLEQDMVAGGEGDAAGTAEA